MSCAYRYLWMVPLLLTIGCAGSDSTNPTQPNLPDQPESITLQSSTGIQTSRFLWGLWKVRIAADHQSAEIIPQRAAEMHLNTVRLLEVTPCTDCLTIGNINLYPPNELTADLTLRHPYPGLLKYTGFDVRGILITGADYTFPVSGRSIAWGDDFPRLLNADGCTALFNPTEFPETAPPALGYIPGKYATGGDLLATLNPFVAYAEDAPRRMFEAGSTKTRTVLLRVPDRPFEFGYAVDACWQLVDGEVTDPVNDFPPDANCLEAYRMDVQVGAGLQPEAGSSVPIHVEVYDHQGIDTISTMTIEAPELFPGELALNFSTVTGEESSLFTGMVPNELGAEIGEYPLLVRVVDTDTDQNLGVVDGWRVYSVHVGPKRGWARTWGAEERDKGCAVAVDGFGNLYVTGYFEETVDFDPGPATEEHSSNGKSDVFLSKFDSSGDLLWARTWGGTAYDSGYGMAADDLGNVYVTGRFSETVDFDPGPGVEEHTSNGGLDVFLSKFDSRGEFQWACAWGGPSSHDIGYGVAANGSEHVYVKGSFSGTVDFDPGPGTEEHTSNRIMDVFVSKFDCDGTFHWASTWGPIFDDHESTVAVDSLGTAYITGSFTGTVDFDPGLGTEERTSNGNRDVFLNKLDSNGDFDWVHTWGGWSAEAGWNVAVDSPGNVYVTGFFGETVDFDPGPGTAERSSNGRADVFVSKFFWNGEFQWVRTWGGDELDAGLAITLDAYGNAYVTGVFKSTVDFDPGLGTEQHRSNGLRDVFLSKFDSSAEFLWAGTWGGELRDYGLGVAVDSYGTAYVTGIFGYTVDFDPGPGTDYHTSNGWGDVFLSKFPPDGNW